jgi:hypothetical protein
MVVSGLISAVTNPMTPSHQHQQNNGTSGSLFQFPTSAAAANLANFATLSAAVMAASPNLLQSPYLQQMQQHQTPKGFNRSPEFELKTPVIRELAFDANFSNALAAAAIASKK